MNILWFFSYGCTAMWHTCVHAQSSTAGGTQPVWNLQDRNKWPIPSIKLLSIVCDGKNGPCWREEVMSNLYSLYLYGQEHPSHFNFTVKASWSISRVNGGLDSVGTWISSCTSHFDSCCSWMFSKKLKWVQAMSNGCCSEKVYLSRILKISILLGWTEEKIYFSPFVD